jgi:molybdenum cofactor cytidylyltransferase
MTPRHGALVLAAGASRRLGRPKQLLRIAGESLLRRAARLALESGADDVIVVLGHRAVEMAAEISDLPLRWIAAQDWDAGLGASLRQGAAALPAACDGVLVLLCDQPALDVVHLRGLVRLWQAAPLRAAASAYAGVAGVPALLPRSWLQLQAPGDQGARALLRSRPDEVDLLPNEALARDVDTSADWPYG